MIKFPVNKIDPMNGIFHFLVDKKLTSLVSAGEKTTSRLTAIDLIYRNPENWYASPCSDEGYIEFNISKFKVYIYGYGIMTYYNDDNVPRNWRIVCTDEEKEHELTREESNQELCTGIAPYANCGISDKKAFYMQHPMYCNRIRFYGGEDSSNQYYIQMSGFELFGEIGIGKESKCYCNRYRSSLFIISLILLIVYV